MGPMAGSSSPRVLAIPRVAIAVATFITFFLLFTLSWKIVNISDYIIFDSFTLYSFSDSFLLGDRVYLINRKFFFLSFMSLRLKFQVSCFSHLLRETPVNCTFKNQEENLKYYIMILMIQLFL